MNYEYAETGPQSRNYIITNYIIVEYIKLLCFFASSGWFRLRTKFHLQILDHLKIRYANQFSEPSHYHQGQKELRTLRWEVGQEVHLE
jgi:hypothetical protein